MTATVMSDRSYLDWTATAPLRPQAREAMVRALERIGNPSSVHAEGRAARDGLSSEPARMTALRERLEAGLKAASPEIVIFGIDQKRLPNTTLCAMPGTKAETAIIAFDLEGFALSSGAACSSGKVQPSHVLGAMGVPPQLGRAALRISLGPTTSESDIDRFVRAWINVSAVLLKESRGIAA